MQPIDIPTDARLTQLIENLLTKLKSKRISVFKHKPTIYYRDFKGSYYFLYLIDENSTDFQFVKFKSDIIDQLSESLIIPLEHERMDRDFPRYYGDPKFVDKVIESYQFTNSTRSKMGINLERIRKLQESGFYYASIIILVSAFENGTRDVFFDNKDVWFKHDSKRDQDIKKHLAEKYGKKTPFPEGHHKREIIHEGASQTYYFDSNSIEKYNGFSLFHKDKEMLKVLRDLGIEKTFIKLWSRPTGFASLSDEDLLAEILEDPNNYGINALNFQDLNVFKKIMKGFFGIELSPIEDVVNNYKDILELRHKIIHDTVREEQITPKMVQEGIYQLKELMYFIRYEISKEKLHW